MRQSLFPSDDALPTWLHTVLLMAIVSPFCLSLLWPGLQAIRAHELAPFGFQGDYFFGGVMLHGRQAVLAGFALVMLAGVFPALALCLSRFERVRHWACISMGVLFALFLVFSYGV